MARKKVEPIVSLGNEDKLTVQKSLPLSALWRSNLTLAEFKILDTYLSRINSHNPNKRVVVFEKGELEKLLGVKKINNKELEERLKHLMENVVKIPDTDEKKGFRLISLFEEAVAEQDEYGLWQINLECTQKAMKYIFNIENLRYLRYKLRCITSITSRYTYIMFLYIEAKRSSNQFMKSWEVPLEELKQILNCDKEEYATEFKYFNRDILKKIQKELHEKTECRYEYEPIKKGRSVVAIKFTLKALPTTSIENIDEKQITIEQWQAENQDRALWEEVVADFNFTREQINTLQEVLVCIPEHKMPQSTACYDDCELRRYHYMRIKVAEMNNRPNIKRPFAYLLKMLKQDADIK
jgi:plasmid replication initiation protein